MVGAHGPRQVKVVKSVSSAVARHRQALLLAELDVRLGKVGKGLLEFKWRLNKGSRETHGHMPLKMAVEEPNTRVVGAESDADRRASININGIATKRSLGQGLIPAIKSAASNNRTVKNLEVVAVEVEGVVGLSLVVENDFNDLAAVDDFGVDLAVDLGAQGVFSNSEGSVEGGSLLVHVADTIDEGAKRVVKQVVSNMA